MFRDKYPGNLEGDFIKNLANILTGIRIIASIIILCVRPLSCLFWILYLCCGISDILDGYAARSLKQESEKGAKLDSIADIIFGMSMIIVFIQSVSIPEWLWLCVFIVLLIRMSAYFIGYKKYQSFSSLHTYSNKITGFLLFCTPVLLEILDISITGGLLSLSAIISALEELIITIISKDLNRNCKSIFRECIRLKKE
ncbi:CDP-alcohol phosphatidyltransferase family protein [Alloiococcus sp. CFN-8]|uniref:CDP-alcohol phosphatidyltransferase family protein n=1 Tax=Alloiococcus sp. CFN-8 TaxID=3416081 RepID=UPI003CF1F8F0